MNEKEDIWKTLLEKEKMLINGIFSFSHDVFYHPLKHILIFESHLLCRLQRLSNSTSLTFCCFVKSNMMWFIFWR